MREERDANIEELDDVAAGVDAGVDADWRSAWNTERLLSGCLGRRRVSGRYQGLRNGLTSPQSVLDLRVDIDQRYSESSPVMNRVSGDVYSRRPFVPTPKNPWPIVGAVYQNSWIIDRPKVTRTLCSVVITGSVRFWSGVLPPGKAKITITWTGTALQAVAAFTSGLTTTTYTCAYVSDAFRNMTMEIDLCNSVNGTPTLPSYPTDALSDRPADTPVRTLTIERAYREAGVDVRMSAASAVDDSAASFSSWSVGELHDAMETHFSVFGSSWPRWDMWGVLGGAFNNPNVAGIMFDAAAAYGGAGEAPDRQGYAVFKQHSWFANLVAAPSTTAEWEAMRTFLYTYVHEAGHAFNFLHSWNKGRPDSRSWMNYPHNITGFYDSFYLRFDDEELIHMRHGDRRSVIMGGDSWASGNHMESTSLHLMGGPDDASPIEVLLRAKEYFEFMEPVSVEVRLRNLLMDTPVTVDTRLAPEFGVLAFTIQGPDDRVIEYQPLFCALGSPETIVLKAANTGAVGEDRYSQMVPLTFGQNGFAFERPGEYKIRCFYVDEQGFVTPSKTLSVRIGRPITREEDRLAQDYFSRATGLVLALGEHRSPHLTSGADALREIIARGKGSETAATLGVMLAQSHARSFHRIQSLTGKGKVALKLAAKAEPKRVVQLTQDALKRAKADTRKTGNLAYREVVELRASCLRASGEARKATSEVTAMKRDLAARGVHPVVLKSVK